MKLTIAGMYPEVPAPPDAKDPAVQVWREEDGTIVAYGYEARELHWMYLPGVATFCFGSGNEGITATAHPPVREDWILDAYRRTVLPMALQVRGQEVLHASAVSTPQGVLALCAVSGTGKSTTAFALSQRGWPLWADDAVVFENTQSGARALPLPFGIRLLPDAASFLDRKLPARVDSNGDDGDQVGTEPMPLAALLVLGRMGDDDEGNGAAVKIRRLPPTRAFVAVLTHAYCFSLRNEQRKRTMMRHYLDLVDRVPAFEVSFRPGFEVLPAVLDGIGELVSTLGVQPELYTTRSRELLRS